MQYAIFLTYVARRYDEVQLIYIQVNNYFKPAACIVSFKDTRI